MSTYFPKQGDITRKWFVLDATDQTLGRLASRAASILAGKDNPKYTPFIDTGDHVVVINAEKVKLTGQKPEQKCNVAVALMMVVGRAMTEDGEPDTVEFLRASIIT